MSSHSHCLSLYRSVSSPCPFSVSFSIQSLSFLCIDQCLVTIKSLSLYHSVSSPCLFSVFLSCLVPFLSLYHSVSSPCHFSVSFSIQSLSFLRIIQYPVPVLSLYHSVFSPCPFSLSFSVQSLSFICIIQCPFCFFFFSSVQSLSFLSIDQCLVTSHFLCIGQCPVLVLSLYHLVSSPGPILCIDQCHVTVIFSVTFSVQSRSFSVYWSGSNHRHCFSLYCSVSSPCPFSVLISV